MNKFYSVILVMLVLFSFGCSPKEEKKDEASMVKEVKKPKVKYKILEVQALANVRYSVDLEIASEIEESEIKEVFDYIKSGHDGYPRYFVHFFLPSMKTGAGAWATANYDDKGLDITIRGMTVADEKNLKARSFDGSIGVWKDNTVMKSIVHLIKIDGKYFIRLEYQSGGFTDKAVTRNKNDFVVDDSSTGDFYKIVDDGLEVWTENGKFAIYDIIKKPDLDKL